jgi:hypothetical protein
VSSTQIKLTWGAASETGGVISQYRIERCQGTGCSTFAQVGTATGTSYNDAGLTAATAYSYRVRAADSSGNTGPYSNLASATAASAGGGGGPTSYRPATRPADPAAPVSIRLARRWPGDLNVVVVGWGERRRGRHRDRLQRQRLPPGRRTRRHQRHGHSGVYYAANIVVLWRAPTRSL